MAVLGDSVAWGQGLLPAHKYSTLVATALGVAAGPEIYAHSGAVIDPTGSLGSTVAPCSRISSEIPLSAPTIRAQVKTVANPQTVDLVLLNGGINDVDIRRILNPLTRTGELAHWIQSDCYVGMKILLGEAVQTFTSPSARIVVTGYYPILSDQSDRSLIKDFLSLFGIALPFNLAPDPLLTRITQLCLQFWHQSDQALAKAASETATQLNWQNRLIYVSGPLTETNSAFAPSPMLFQPANGLNPADEVAADRRVACDRCYTDPLDIAAHEACRLASVGHPNVQGAQAFANAILAKL